MAVKKPWTDLLEGPGKPGRKSDGTAAAEAPGQPVASPTTVYMHTVIGSPDNPRTDLDYSDEDAEFYELKKSMQSVGQLQPAVAVSSEAFRRAKPEHAAAVEGADWVVVLGNRRLHAARQLGWTKFEIRVRDRLGGEDDEKLDEAVIIENIHRKNIAPYKEAEFLRRMIERHGSQEKVAERIGKSQMYVSNRLALLNLAPELREAVDTKQLKVKTAEQIAKIKDPQEQKAKAEQEMAKARQPKERRPRARPAPQPQPEPRPEQPAAPPDVPGRPEVPRLSVPEQTAVDTAPEGDRKPVLFPYRDGAAAARLLIHKMPPTELDRMIELLVRSRERQAAEDSAAE
ncbi:ParB/RepB/Spo0J family partition protein [Streptomyces sp. NPDC047999]|uniref:ParB/RepB/Spo0J family partition protein n=1 Tax=Streptomyces sp. NPDC047999 TaxID=3365497 RepID=UPI003720FCEE